MSTSDELMVDAWRTLLVTHALVTGELDREMRAQSGFGLDVYDVLLHTYEAGSEGIRMTDLAENLVVSKSGLTTRVDRLQQRGLLERVPDPRDRRATRIKLTSTAESVFREAAGIHLSGIQRHFGDRLTAADARRLVDILGKVTAADTAD